MKKINLKQAKTIGIRDLRDQLPTVSKSGKVYIVTNWTEKLMVMVPYEMVAPKKQKN